MKAVRQLTEHAKNIRHGKWAPYGLAPAESIVGVVVSYGQIHTANGPFMRDRVKHDLTELGVEPIPYVVLSLEELDYVVRLVELGHSLDQVVDSLTATEGSFDPLRRYASAFQGHRAISSFSYDRADRFMTAMTSNRTPRFAPNLR